jgi:hypothetical protein
VNQTDSNDYGPLNCGDLVMKGSNVVIRIIFELIKSFELKSAVDDMTHEVN